MAKMRVYKYVEGSVEITENSQQKAIEKINNCGISTWMKPTYFTYKEEAFEHYNEVISCSHLQTAHSFWSKGTHFFTFDVVRLEELFFDSEEVEDIYNQYTTLDQVLNHLTPIDWGEEWLFVSKEEH